MIISKGYIKNKVLCANLDGIIIGLCVGVVINFFFLANSSGPFEWSDVAIPFMFSILISMGVSNSVVMAQYFFSKNVKSFWVSVIGYYGGTLLGVAFGHEISYFIVSRIYDFPYTLSDHLDSLLISLGIGVIVSTILFAYEMQKKRHDAIVKQKELEVVKLKQLKTQAELQALQSKINPHFLYNSLNSIASLIREQPVKAEEMTLKLSKLFRYSISGQSDNLVTIKEELEIVKTYLDIELIRFGDRMTIAYDTDEELLNQQIPRFLIQPLVENALKHGLSHVASHGRLSVTIEKLDGMMEISVCDNGMPFPDELSTGYGLESTYEKLNLLYPDNFEVQMINMPEKFIRIRIPLNGSYP